MEQWMWKREEIKKKKTVTNLKIMKYETRAIASPQKLEFRESVESSGKNNLGTTSSFLFLLTKISTLQSNDENDRTKKKP